MHRLYRDAIKFQSARAAFQALLLAGEPQRVWLPKYICNVIPEVLHTLDIECDFYDLYPHIGVAASVNIDATDWLLYVNYFGICRQQQQLLMSLCNPSQLIFDHLQDYFSPPVINALATIYSPRKFFSIPGGGLFLTSLTITESDQLNTHSLTRCSHLLARLHSATAAGYAALQEAELTLSNSRPLGTSILSRRLLEQYRRRSRAAALQQQFPILT